MYTRSLYMPSTLFSFSDCEGQVCFESAILCFLSFPKPFITWEKVHYWKISVLDVSCEPSTSFSLPVTVFEGVDNYIFFTTAPEKVRDRNCNAWSPCTLTINFLSLHRLKDYPAR